MRILDDWTSAKIKIRKTEQELKKKIKNDPIKYLGILPNETYEEYQTEQGPVDLLFCMTSFGDPDNTLHVVEVKRGKINVNNLVQLEKYLGCLYEDKVAYIAAPDIGVKAQKYCEKNSITYVCVDFD